MSLPIPYRIEPHPVTGTTNGKLATWLFLASEVMLFGALFSSYLMLRVGAGTAWPSGRQFLNGAVGGVNTGLLLLSTATTYFSVQGLRRRSWRAYSVGFLLTLLFSFSFLGIKALEYRTEWGRGFFPSSNNFLGLYFALTGLHALHLLGGIGVVLYLLLFGRSLDKRIPGLTLRRAECAFLYWQFIDGIWLILYVGLYWF